MFSEYDGTGYASVGKFGAGSLSRWQHHSFPANQIPAYWRKYYISFFPLMLEIRGDFNSRSNVL